MHNHTNNVQVITDGLTYHASAQRIQYCPDCPLSLEEVEQCFTLQYSVHELLTE